MVIIIIRIAVRPAELLPTPRPRNAAGSDDVILRIKQTRYDR
jgi:hypothetical protein